MHHSWGYITFSNGCSGKNHDVLGSAKQVLLQSLYAIVIHKDAINDRFTF